MNLLLDEHPLIVIPSLAMQVGLQESIFLQQLHYWLNRSTHVKEGERWVYNSVKEWQVQFPFWSESTIRRIIRSLEEKGLVQSDNFNQLPMDHTKWYRIDYPRLKEWLGEPCSQNEHIACSEWTEDVSTLNRAIPEITTENNNNAEAVELENLQDVEWAEVHDFFQTQGFGPCTSLVGGKMEGWIKDLSKELVIHAMKMAIDNGVMKWVYVESILRDWAQGNIKTVGEVEARELQRKQRGIRKSSPPGRHYEEFVFDAGKGEFW